MSTSPNPAEGQTSEGKILIAVLIIGVIAAIGFRYHLNSDKPAGDSEFIRRKATVEEFPSMEGNKLMAPPV